MKISEDDHLGSDIVRSIWAYDNTTTVPWVSSYIAGHIACKLARRLSPAHDIAEENRSTPQIYIYITY